MSLLLRLRTITIRLLILFDKYFIDKFIFFGNYCSLFLSIYVCVSFDLKSGFSSELFEPELHVWLYSYIIIHSIEDKRHRLF